MKTLICAETECAKNPSLIGLERSDFNNSDVDVATSSFEARAKANALDAHDRVFVVSSDDIDSINLAAALKKDRSDLKVDLVSNELSGSLFTRAEAAKIDAVVPAKSLRSKLITLPQIEEDCADIDDATPAHPRNSKCWIMSVFSGSGGAGKSAVSAVSADLLSALGLKVLLFDADFQLGDLSLAFRNHEVIPGEALIKTSAPLKNFEGDLAIVGAPTNLEMCDALVSRLPAIAAEATNYFDAIVFNTGANWSEAHVNLLKLSDLNLFLIDQRVSSIRGLKRVLDLCTRLNLSTLNFAFALNKCEKKAAITPIDVVDALRIKECFEIKQGTMKVEESISSGFVEDLVKERNPMAVSLFEILKSSCPFSRMAHFGKATQ